MVLFLALVFMFLFGLVAGHFVTSKAVKLVDRSEREHFDRYRKVEQYMRDTVDEYQKILSTKACPFCGETDSLYVSLRDHREYSGGSYVFCDCRASNYSVIWTDGMSIEDWIDSDLIIQADRYRERVLKEIDGA